MTANEFKALMLEFPTERITEYEKQLAALGAESKNERKALTVQKNITANCAAFLNYEYGGRYFEVRENILFRQLNAFEALKPEYDALDDEGKKLFLIYAQAVFMVTKNFYEPRAELLKTETNASKVFEAKLIVGTVGEILDRWRSLWDAHGSMKCEVAL